MNPVSYMVAAALAVLPATALAQPPFEISGLHTDLVFTEAMSKAETLGGDCRISNSRTKEGAKMAYCEFLPCIARNTAGGCAKYSMESPPLTIASQPVLRIALEAPGDASPLTRIIITYEGNTGAVAQSLTSTFGRADNDSGSRPEPSWSGSRRLSWTQGIYRMGLIDDPKLLILAADRTPHPPGPGAS